MPDRTRLHELVDTLPEAALALAQGSLEHLQTWPPQEPLQAREFRDQQLERMRGSIRPGTGGGGSYQIGPGGRREYGHQARSVATLREQAQRNSVRHLHHLAIWNSPAMKSRRRST